MSGSKLKDAAKHPTTPGWIAVAMMAFTGVGFLTVQLNQAETGGEARGVLKTQVDTNGRDIEDNKIELTRKADVSRVEDLEEKHQEYQTIQRSIQNDVSQIKTDQAVTIEKIDNLKQAIERNGGG